MVTSCDVIVAGLGAMGSAAAAHLAQRGLRVVGVEQFTPGHDRGSSHGETRIIRQAYFEDPAYIPLLLRSYELWEDLDRDDPGIFTITGGLMIGAPSAGAVAGSIRSAEVWNLPHEVLDEAQLAERFPVFTPSAGTIALHEKRAGFVRPERTVLAHLARARRGGADLRFGERVLEWKAADGHVEVRTDASTYRADRLVIAPGAWASVLLPDLAPSLTVERQVLFWFHPADVGVFMAPDFPIFVWEDTDGVQVYGFPASGGPGGGVKVAFARKGPITDPQNIDRVVHQEEIDDIAEYLATRIPTLPARFDRAATCMYTTTPDKHFIISILAEHPEVTVAAGFSGHGFKFVPVVGEIIADLVMDGRTGYPIDLFDPGRLRAAQSSSDARSQEGP